MWDTTKDYRILVASKARENYLNLIPTASFSPIINIFLSGR